MTTINYPVEEIKSVGIKVADRIFPGINLKGLYGPGIPTFIVIELKEKEKEDG